MSKVSRMIQMVAVNEVPSFQRPPHTQYTKLKMLGLHISNVNSREILAEIDSAIRLRTRTTVACVNAYYANEAQRDPLLRDFFNSVQILHPDGIGIYWASRLLHGDQGLTQRLTGTDLYYEIVGEAERRRWSVFLFGDRAEVVQSARDRLKTSFPQLLIVGCHHGYVELDDPRPRELIQAARPDILLLGLGMPRQERWLAKFRAKLDVPACVAVGAGIAYFSQELPRAPMWMREIGLEWLFRLAVEPRRLWRRYLLGNPVFLMRILLQRLGA